jgi:hypothetical protein
MWSTHYVMYGIQFIALQAYIVYSMQFVTRVLWLRGFPTEHDSILTGLWKGGEGRVTNGSGCEAGERHRNAFGKTQLLRSVCSFLPHNSYFIASR